MSLPLGADPAAPVALTFLIPVRHPANAADWGQLKANLAQTLASLANQRGQLWRAYIAAQEGADLPPLPPGAHAVRVGFPPNPAYSPEGQSRADFHAAVRLDKGRRILAALLAAGPTAHLMVVDDDDFVSNRLAETAATTPETQAWRFDEGLVWTPGSRMVARHSDFSSLCGTSLIVPRAAFQLPPSIEAASPGFISTLGSHILIKDAVEQAGVTFQPLPFAGAVYRTGHSNAHSRSRSILRTWLLNRAVLASPARTLDGLRRLRLYGAAERQEFALP